TNQRLGRIPLIIGMPVMIMNNYDVQGGIVNGTLGTLKSIRYCINEFCEREALSCVVNSSTLTCPPLPFLEAGEAAILPDTIDMSF
ncbi:hypothetical protein AGABI1DRAFT_16924, partial [Agaricus bisporus var. burnettii JB137-S8]